jgi:thioredoxin-related protein
MMKKLCLLAIAAIFSAVLFAQNNPATLPMAPFEITLTNDVKFKSFQLKKNVPVILMYFSPDCDHCKDLTKEILKNVKALEAKQLVMITYYPMAEVKKFANDFSIQKQPNIKIGTEGMTLIVQKHYNIRNFPFLALYDKAGKQARLFREQAPSADIIKAIQQLK